MSRTTTPTEPTVYRRVFEAWSIEVPLGFAETFVNDEGSYWHAYDEHRSVSLTSVVIEEAGDPVSADRILRQVGGLDGSPVDRLPSGLLGEAATDDAPPDSRASRFLSGLLAMDGRLLLVTITCDDLEWVLRVWLSIRGHPAPFQPVGRRGHGGAGRRRGH